MRTPKTPKDWGLDGRDAQRLRRALSRVVDLRLYRRLQAVLIVARGGSCREACVLVGTTYLAVLRWVRRYLRRHRMEDLADTPRSVRPPAAVGLTDRILAREFAKDPMALGYRATAWTVPLLSRHLTQVCRCVVTRRTLRRRMHAMDLVWKRPRHVFSDKAKHLPQKKGALFAA